MARDQLDPFEAAIRTCTNCDALVKPPAICYCQTCEEFLCLACNELHTKWRKNSDHSVISVSKLDLGMDDIKQMSKDQPEDSLMCVCRNCEKLCSGCREECHEVGHDVVKKERVRDDVDRLLEEASAKIKTVVKHAEYVDEQKERVKEAVGGCRDEIEKAHEEALARLEAKRIAQLEACERREAAMLDSLEEVIDMDNALVSSLTSACSMAGKGGKNLSKKGRGV